jgi:hypothetical protein
MSRYAEEIRVGLGREEQLVKERIFVLVEDFAVGAALGILGKHAGSQGRQRD